MWGGKKLRRKGQKNPLGDGETERELRGRSPLGVSGWKVERGGETGTCVWLKGGTRRKTPSKLLFTRRMTQLACTPHHSESTNQKLLATLDQYRILQVCDPRGQCTMSVLARRADQQQIQRAQKLTK